MPLPYSPLSKAQESLRGRKLADMTDEQLRLWLTACDTMEQWVKFPKARRSWSKSRSAAEAEIARRGRKLPHRLQLEGFRIPLPRRFHAPPPQVERCVRPNLVSTLSGQDH